MSSSGPLPRLYSRGCFLDPPGLYSFHRCGELSCYSFIILMFKFPVQDPTLTAPINPFLSQLLSERPVLSFRLSSSRDGQPPESRTLSDLLSTKHKGQGCRLTHRSPGKTRQQPESGQQHFWVTRNEVRPFKIGHTMTIQ